MRRRRGLGEKTVRGGLLGLLLALAACRRPAGEPERAVRIGQDSDVLSLDPSYPEVNTFSALSNVYEPLVGYDARLAVVPVLASSWTTPKPNRWVFELRSGVRFHDGAPLRAADVVEALDRVRSDPASGVRAQLWAVKETVAVGDLRLEIRTREPDALLLHELTRVLIAAKRSGGRFVGTGPYRIARWQRGVSLRLEAVPAYWGKRPAMGAAELLPVPEGDASLAALREGRVDLAEIPSSSVDAAKAAGLRLATSPGLTAYFLSFSGRAGPDGRPTPFAHRRVRQALSLAVDRRALAERVVGKAEYAADQAVPRSIFGFDPALAPIRFDPGEARRLLAQEGLETPVPLVIAHRDAPVQAAIARELAGPLSAAGFEVVLRPLAWKDLVDGMRQGRLPITLWSWDFDNADAASFLRDIVHSRDDRRGLGSFNPGFSSEEMDRLVAEATRAFEPEVRREILGRAMRLVRDESVVIPLFNPPHVYAFTPRLRFRPRVDDLFQVAEMAWGEKTGSD